MRVLKMGTIAFVALSSCGRPLVGLIPLPDGAPPDAPRKLDAATNRTDGPLLDPMGNPVQNWLAMTDQIPPNGFSGAAVNVTISVTFTKDMKPGTLNDKTFIVKQGDVVIPGDVIMRPGKRAAFDPDKKLAPNTECTVTVTTGARSVDDERLETDYSWTFTTGTAIQPPTVTGTKPENAAINILNHRQLEVQFSRRMNDMTVNDKSFVVQQGGTPVGGKVVYSAASWTATFTPTTRLGSSLPLQATITTAAQDRAMVPLDTPYVWTFRIAACTQEPIPLGLASTFAVLAGMEVNSSGSTSVTGDLGVSPGTTVRGFPPGTVKGTTNAGNPVAAAAMDSLRVAYDTAKAQAMCPLAISGDLGGKTLAPGLYSATAAVVLDMDDLTLDAQDDPSAVFIFQFADSLTTSTARKIILKNSANAANVFWQIGTSATLGPNSTFYGTLLADQSITLGAGAGVTGRLLARTGTVTLDGNRVDKP